MDKARLLLAWTFLATGLITVSKCFDPLFVRAGHKLFTKTTRANASVVFYQHRLAIGQFVQLPCFSRDKEMYPSATDTAAYEWLLNGRQILHHLSFMRASWDLDGVLSISAIMPREYTLWCHMKFSDETEDQDFYFAHQIKFFQEPVRQLILGVLIRAYMDEEAWERKCRAEVYTCDCRRIYGENATERYSPGSRNYYFRTIVNDAAIDTCERFHFCQTFSVDQLECLNAEHFWNASHYVEISFLMDRDRSPKENSVNQRYDTATMTTMIYNHLISLQSVINQRVLDAIKNNYYARNPRLEMMIYNQSYVYCMGYASSLNRETEECELCPAGSFANARLVSPKPPFTSRDYKPLRTDQPHLSDEHQRRALIPHWLHMEEKTACNSCPENTYTEESGRLLCLPCPVWHMRPKTTGTGINQYSGADWLHSACPPEGRNQLRLVQVAEGMLGERFSRWVKESSPLSRVAAMLVLLFIPIAITLVALFIAYMLIDVGAVIVRMAKELHPLQIQIAETAIATAAFKADHQKATEEAYAKMRGE